MDEQIPQRSPPPQEPWPVIQSKPRPSRAAAVLAFLAGFVCVFAGLVAIATSTVALGAPHTQANGLGGIAITAVISVAALITFGALRAWKWFCMGVVAGICLIGLLIGLCFAVFTGP
jgi:hypothetical protein